MDIQICTQATSFHPRSSIPTTLYTLNEVVTLSKKIEYQHLRAGSKFSNCSLDSSSSTANKSKQPMFTPQSQPMVRKNSGVNQSTMTVAGSTVQPIANTNPYVRPTGNKCYRCGEPGHQSSTCPKRGTVNLVVAKEGEAKGEKEGEEVYNDADPYAYDPNEVQEDEEGVSLERSLVFQSCCLHQGWIIVISGIRSSEHVAPLV